MAGESPDRSKQHKSSEPTSGSAGSVPETRDPRLAVSREKDSSGAAVDTATKVLSVRDVKEAAGSAEDGRKSEDGRKPEASRDEDADLREAVSAWVRSADTTKKSKPEADASAKTSDKPEESGKTGNTGNTGKTEDRSSEPGQQAESASESDAETAAEAEPKPKPDTRADADTDTDRDMDAGSGSGSASGSGSGSDADAKADADAEADAASDPNSGPKAEADAETDAASESGEEIEGPADDMDAETDTKAEVGAGAASKAAEDATKSAAADKAKAAAADAAKTAAADKAKTAAVDRAKAAAASKAKRAAADKAAAADKTTAAVTDKTKAAVADKTKAVAADKAADEDEPTAADGEDTPQGPPAADDETRTGGAGGKEEAAEGEAEAEGAEAKGAEAKGAGPKGGVDQPTAVFKSVRPKKPEVDQPTTMLKLGDSKFVPLKNPDVTTSVPHVGPERTTQQPLPPKPPLDLLAELTNTPPPAETPVRTIVRRVKIWTPLALLLVIVFAVVQAFRPLPSPTLALSAKDSYTFGGDKLQLPWPNEGQGWVDGDGIGNMGNFGKQTPVAIGSVAKTMTSYIILRDHPLKPGEEGPKIKIDPTAEKEGGYYKAGESTLNTVKAGDYLTEKQALSAVMIPSANNIARLLARWDLGSEAAFVKKMNDTAKELGMTNTKYTDPSGLKETTVSTAEDQVKLGRAVTKIPALVAITSAASWTDPTGHFWNNVNELPYRIGAIGIKTGSTTAAGGNLLFASRKQVGGQTVTIVGAILGQHKPKILETVNAVSKTALLAAQEALTSSKILKKGDVVGYVDDQLGGHTPIVLTKDVSAVGWAGLKVKLSFTSDTVPHTAKAGTTVGTLTVGDGTAGAVKVPVALQKDLAEPGFTDKLTRLG
ncbi:D-alanyl-D-alanine carboxypeptidase [Streptomyces sp. NPDC007971]|uniref:D-alanyl-D-alanine carboxypeptidase n=1 Tax=Streptomyces sp. NPDC007971 TaxID=3364799 RepID=UPI0036F17D6E